MVFLKSASSNCLIEVLASSNYGLMPLSPAYMNKVLDYFMPLMMPKIAAKLKSIPLHRIAGYIHPEGFGYRQRVYNNLA
jgi:hypothetical protein